MGATTAQIAALKQEFETGDTPSGAHFAQLIDCLYDQPASGGGSAVVHVLEAGTTGTGATITYDNVADKATLDSITGNDGEFAFVATDPDPANFNGTYQWSEHSTDGFKEAFGWKFRTAQKLSNPAYLAGTNGETIIRLLGVDGQSSRNISPRCFIKLPSRSQCSDLNIPDRTVIRIEADRTGGNDYYVYGNFTGGSSHAFGTSDWFGTVDGTSAMKFGKRGITEFYVTKGLTDYSDWMPSGGAALIASSYSGDGWGGGLSVNSRGEVQRYTLTEAQFDVVSQVVDNGVIQGFPVTPGPRNPNQPLYCLHDNGKFDLAGTFTPAPPIASTPAIMAWYSNAGSWDEGWYTRCRDTHPIYDYGDGTGCIRDYGNLSAPFWSYPCVGTELYINGVLQDPSTYTSDQPLDYGDYRPTIINVPPAGGTATLIYYSKLPTG